MYWFGEIFLFLLGACWIIAGALYLIVPAQTKILFRRFLKGANIQKLGLIPLIAGILLYLIADMSSLVWLLKTFGMLGILKGLFFIFTPRKTIQAFINWWCNQAANWLYRLSGILIIVLGGSVIVSLFS